MNISLLKLITIISVIIGAVCGFLTLLPYIGGVIFFILMTLSSVIGIILLMHLGGLRFDSAAESAVIGGIIGFVSFIAFSIIYMPLVIIFLKIFKYYTNYGVALALNNANLFIIIVLSVFIAILSATINAFTGFLTYYFTELNKNKNRK